MSVGRRRVELTTARVDKAEVETDSELVASRLGYDEHWGDGGWGVVDRADDSCREPCLELILDDCLHVCTVGRLTELRGVGLTDEG